MKAFPDDFVWGVATAAYQIEGAVDEGGRGESIWDRFSHTPGKTLNGETGDVACDHYHRWQSDIEIMRELNVSAYRFSIAWPRIIADGTGSVNQAGLDFYDRLVDGLLAAGITPFPTLYHWDLPQPLEDAGGWPERATAEAFGEYAGVVGARLGDRVKDWFTINEPWCVAELGYRYGMHAPGRSDPDDALAAAHHALLAHGLGMQAINAAAPDARVGVVINVDAVVPRSLHPSDVEAAVLFDSHRNRWYLDPVLTGEYPAAALAFRGWNQGEVMEGDLDIISAPMGHLGINYYSRTVVADESVDDSERPAPVVEANLPRTTMEWEIYPDGLRETLVAYNGDYDLPPVYITENGAAFPDELVEGAVPDQERIDFLAAHFAAADQAIDSGVPLRGIFVWSLLDNFEWGFGYSQRFGLVWTDYETQQRTLKDSARWFSEYVAGD